MKQASSTPGRTDGVSSSSRSSGTSSDPESLIRQYYENPRYGLFSAPKLAKTIRSQHPEIRTADVVRFVARQPAAQINHEVHLNRRDKYNKILAFHPNDV